MKKTVYMLAALAMALVAAPMASAAGHADKPFFDTSRSSKFLELRAYALGGGSTVTQNYINCFPQITELNASMGFSGGFGGSAQFVIRDFLSLGTELNFLFNRYTVDMAITGDGISSVSSVFLDNRYNVIDIPLYMSVRFNLSRGVRWNVEGGVYFSHGISGSQRQNIYDSRVNDIGQLVMNHDTRKVGYYGDEDGFLHTMNRGDFGLHIGTGLTFGRHIFVGLRTRLGFRNVSTTQGIVNPNIHNIGVHVQVGYKFDSI